MNRHIDMALSFARAYDHDPKLTAILTAMIVSGGRVLSVGFNRRKPSGNGLQEYYKTNPFCNSIHAEVDAVLSARKKIDLRGSKMYIVRRQRGDTIENPKIALAKPCTMCQAVLYSYGIKRAMYTISNNEYGIMKVVDPRTEE
jgi:tRNA(Arg) A34 adenosine deaminase TadA